MKKLFIVSLLISFTQQLHAQQTERTIELLLQLDSVSKSSSVASHFATIYLETTADAVDFFSRADAKTQALMERLEIRFAALFFQSVQAHRNGTAIPEVWRTYFTDSNGSSLRYILYGINAHINGDIWQALTAEFTAAEIRELRPHYFSYHQTLLKNYKDYHRDALTVSGRMRTIHSLSLGFDKLYGKILLARWRKRQLRLAELYFSDPGSFKRKQKKISRKMSRLNALIRIAV